MSRFVPVHNELFHVHTWRCRHAGTTQDYEYVEKAIEMGAGRIVFTDHGPFPGNPFDNRMDYEQLSEYIRSMKELSSKYGERIEVICGLEIEYLAEFRSYLEELHCREDIDLLVLGQHFFAHRPGEYSFLDLDKSMDYIGLSEALIEGVETGFYDVIAHPDRIFRRNKGMTEHQMNIAKQLMDVFTDASSDGIYIEDNYSSRLRCNQYKPEFWGLVDDRIKVLKGVDAHSLSTMDKWKKYREAEENKWNRRLL